MKIVPAALQQSKDEWILWTQSRPINTLSISTEEVAHTVIREGKFENGQECGSSADLAPVISRPQYNAVLAQFKRADMKKGQFSNWAT